MIHEMQNGYSVPGRNEDGFSFVRVTCEDLGSDESREKGSSFGVEAEFAALDELEDRYLNEEKEEEGEVNGLRKEREGRDGRRVKKGRKGRHESSSTSRSLPPRSTALLSGRKKNLPLVDELLDKY